MMHEQTHAPHPGTLSHTLTRRRLLATFGLAGGVALLAACQPAAPAPTPTAAPAAKPTAAPAAAPTTAAPAAPAAAPVAPTAVPAAPTAAPAAAAAGAAQKLELTLQSQPEPYISIVKELAVKPFTAKYPNVSVEIVELSNAQTYPKLVAAKGSPPPPIAAGMWNDSWTARGAGDGMWATLDLGNMPNAAAVIPELNPRAAQGTGIAFGISPFGIAYNPKFVDEPTSWTDLYNPKYKGKVALWDIFFDWLIMAAKIAGGDERNLEPGLKAWEQAKANVGMWAPSLAQLHEALDRGEVWLAADWGSWTLSARAAGKSVEFALPKEGVTQASLNLTVSQGLGPEAKKATEQFLDYYLTREFQAAQTTKTFYGPTRKDVDIPADLLKLKGVVPAQDALQKMVRYDYAYVGAQFNAIKEQVDKRLK